MSLWDRFKSLRAGREQPEHLRRGELGERAAKKHLRQQGLKFLTANFRSDRGEIDLVCRDGDCLVFVEVKTRSSEDWTRPAAHVDGRKRRLLSQTALDYLRLIKNPPIKIRFDIVEVLLSEGEFTRSPSSAELIRHVQALSLRIVGFGKIFTPR